MSQDLLQRISTLMRSQRHCVLCTAGPKGPHASLMALTMDADDTIVLASPTATRKVRNIQADPRVSILVDDRGQGRDPVQALTVSGRARLLEGMEAEGAKALIQARHPGLGTLWAEGEAVLMAVRPESYLLLRGAVEAEYLEMD